MIHYGDITKLSGYTLPPVDVITGGSPCQDLSVAGKRAGLAGERSGLFMEQIRIVKEMRERDRASGRTDDNLRPRYMVWENVPGAFSSNNGEDFQAVLTEIIRIIEPEAPDVPMPARGGGRTAESSTMNWETGALLGDYTTPSTGESPREGNESRLSQILQASVPEKYALSAKACEGILRRAEKRGKELPARLKAALERQAKAENQSASRNEQESPEAAKES